jgi:hypothetical protein
MTKRKAYGLIAFMAGIAGCLTFAELVWAEDTTLTWTNPTGGEECVASGPITLAKTQIWQLIGETDSPDATSYVIEGLMPGVYTYAATAVDDTGRVSRLSGTTEKHRASIPALRDNGEDHCLVQCARRVHGLSGGLDLWRLLATPRWHIE